MTGQTNKQRASFHERACWSRLFAILLSLYPAEFRQAYGNAMVCIFEEKLEEARARSGYYGVLGVWLHTLADLAKSILAERAARVVAVCGIERKTSLVASLAIHGVLLSGIIWSGIHAVQPTHNSCEKQEITRTFGMREYDDVLPRERNDVLKEKQKGPEER